MMDIDKLTKLVKLANHNPNENEANSAARRVCKMIEDAKFRFVDSLGNTIRTPEPEFKSKRPDSPRPSRRQEEFYKMWEEFIRNSGRARQRAPDPFSDGFWDDFKRAEEPFWRKDPFNSERDRKYQVDQYVCITCTQIFKVPAGQKVPDNSQCPTCADKLKYSREWKNQERQFKCKDCGVEVITRFDGEPDEFICFICRIKK